MAVARPNHKVRAALALEQYEKGKEAGRKELMDELYSNGMPGKPKGLTLADIQNWDVDQVNARWDEVCEVLERAEQAQTDDSPDDAA